MLMDEVVEKAAASAIVRSVERLATLLSTINLAPNRLKKLATGVLVFPEHRLTVRRLLYEAAFRSEQEVFYLSIMSKHTLLSMDPLLKDAQTYRTTLKVLTWDPNVGRQVVEAFGRHLGEETSAFLQLSEAKEAWRRLAKNFPKVIEDVRCYSSSPTMQGILVPNDWALIELMPFQTPPDKRPAIYITLQENRELFTVYQDAMQSLWEQSQTILM